MAACRPWKKGRPAMPPVPFYERFGARLNEHRDFILAYIRSAPEGDAASAFRDRESIRGASVGQQAHERHVARNARELADRDASCAPVPDDDRRAPPVPIKAGNAASRRLTRHGAFPGRK